MLIFIDTNLYLFRLNKNNKSNDIYQFIVIYLKYDPYQKVKI